MMQYTDTEAALIGGLISNYCGGCVLEGCLRTCAGASASECAHKLGSSTDTKSGELPHARVSGQPTDTAGANGRQYENDSAAEHGTLIVAFI